MTSRRRFLKAVAGTTAVSALASASDSPSPEPLTRFVNLNIGTGGHGHCFPGATVPFGAVQLSPDTFNDGWDWCSGYHESDTSLMGFSHTHLSGTGIGDMLDVLVVPRTGPVKWTPGTREDPAQGYRSRFSHADEVTVPGYYSVQLRDLGIQAELTSTERAGMHRYTFPENDSSHFVVDLNHRYGNDPKTLLWSEMSVVGSDTIVGGRSTAVWASGRQIYFVLRFSKAFRSAAVHDGEQELDAQSGPHRGKDLKCAVHFDTRADEKITVRVGLSGVSVDGARKNLEAEIPHWDFDLIRQNAASAWERELAKVQVEGSDETLQTIFYSSLYHTMLAPTLFDDVDGQYRGIDSQVHRLPAGQHKYSTFSLWDTYRAEHPLFTILHPERVPDFVNCLIRMAAESPKGLPVWPLQGEETSCMSGYHSAVVIAEAAAKRFAGIDYPAAYKAVRQRVMVDDYEGLGHYRRFGYLPCDLDEESTSKTLDYAYDDWAAAVIARAAGHSAEFETLRERSKNYRHLFDKTDQFIRPRLSSGEWAGPFDPKEISIVKKWKDFTESNSWQTTFAVQHDAAGYIAQFGGRAPFVNKLNALFNQSTDLPPDTPPDIAGLVGMYAHGNEPSHHIAYLYCYAGQPWKTQARVRSLLESMYSNKPDGMAGNEDCGQMSAWFVMSALGFYPVDPASGNYVLGTPLFERVSIHRTNAANPLTITAKRGSGSDRYIHSMTINGKPWTKIWFPHSAIARGGSIVFNMSPEPDHGFGSAAASAPPALEEL